MKYGRAVRTVRVALGMSQRTLADKVGLDASYISLLESDLRNPSEESLTALVSAIGIPRNLLDLLAGEDKDLTGVAPAQAERLGRLLLDLIRVRRAESSA